MQRWQFIRANFAAKRYGNTEKDLIALMGI